MIGGIILGTLGGIAAAKFLHHRRHGRHGFGGGFGPPWARRGGFGGARRLFWLARELDLDRQQRQAARDIAHDVKRTIRDLGLGRERALDAVVTSLGAETFDRARVEAAAAEQGQAIDRVKAAVVDGLERLHALLTPAQRARLRDLTAPPPAAATI
jgi:Spy/CpxP family protein refolding chaperone